MRLLEKVGNFPLENSVRVGRNAIREFAAQLKPRVHAKRVLLGDFLVLYGLECDSRGLRFGLLLGVVLRWVGRVDDLIERYAALHFLRFRNSKANVCRLMEPLLHAVNRKRLLVAFFFDFVETNFLKCAFGLSLQLSEGKRNVLTTTGGVTWLLTAFDVGATVLTKSTTSTAFPFVNGAETFGYLLRRSFTLDLIDDWDADRSLFDLYGSRGPTSPLFVIRLPRRLLTPPGARSPFTGPADALVAGAPGCGGSTRSLLYVNWDVGAFDCFVIGRMSGTFVFRWANGVGCCCRF